MFVTRSGDRFPLPRRLEEPGVEYFRSIGLSTNAAMYVLTVRPLTDEHISTTVLVGWDTDVVAAIEACPAEVGSLLCIAPTDLDGANDGWTSFKVAEIWTATDPAENDNPCVVFVSTDGDDHSGPFAEAKSGLMKARLVARISTRSN